MCRIRVGRGRELLYAYKARIVARYRCKRSLQQAFYRNCNSKELGSRRNKVYLNTVGFLINAYVERPISKCRTERLTRNSVVYRFKKLSISKKLYTLTFNFLLLRKRRYQKNGHETEMHALRTNNTISLKNVKIALQSPPRKTYKTIGSANVKSHYGLSPINIASNGRFRNVDASK